MADKMIVDFQNLVSTDNDDVLLIQSNGVTYSIKLGLIANFILNQITIDNSLSSTSENPVQNKVIYNALSDKASSTHTHSELQNQIDEINECITEISELLTSTEQGLSYLVYGA